MLCQIEVEPVPTETSPHLAQRCVRLCWLPLPKQDQVKVTASTMIGDGSTASSGQNQDHIRVSANVMTADGGNSTAFTCDQATRETPGRPLTFLS